MKTKTKMRIRTNFYLVFYFQFCFFVLLFHFRVHVRFCFYFCFCFPFLPFLLFHFCFCFCFCFLKILAFFYSILPRGAIDDQLSLHWLRSAIHFLLQILHVAQRCHRWSTLSLSLCLSLSLSLSLSVSFSLKTKYRNSVKLDRTRKVLISTLACFLTAITKVLIRDVCTQI